MSLRPEQVRKISVREWSQQGWKIPEPNVKKRYFAMAHGCGMTGEYPFIPHAMDIDSIGVDGIIMPNMALCIKSYIGHEEGGEGVKLEQQVLVTETGVEVLSNYPFDDRLLGDAHNPT